MRRPTATIGSCCLRPQCASPAKIIKGPRSLLPVCFGLPRAEVPTGRCTLPSLRPSLSPHPTPLPLKSPEAPHSQRLQPCRLLSCIATGFSFFSPPKPALRGRISHLELICRRTGDRSLVSGQGLPVNIRPSRRPLTSKESDVCRGRHLLSSRAIEDPFAQVAVHLDSSPGRRPSCRELKVVGSRPLSPRDATTPRLSSCRHLRRGVFLAATCPSPLQAQHLSTGRGSLIRRAQPSHRERERSRRSIFEGAWGEQTVKGDTLTCSSPILVRPPSPFVPACPFFTAYHCTSPERRASSQ